MEPYATTSALPLKNETSCGAKMSNGDCQNDGCDDGHEERRACALLGAADLIDAEVLADERGRRERERLHRQEEKLVNLTVRRPAGHTVCAEVVNIRLYKYVRERGDRHLDGGGMPTRTIFASISLSSFKYLSSTLMQESVRNSVIIVSMAETPCEMMVAYATPLTPMPSDSTKTRSRMMLSTAETTRK